MADRASTVYVTKSPARASYVELVKPKLGAGAKEPKFSLNLILEEADANGIWADIVKVATEQFGPTAAQQLQSGGLKNPLKNGSTPNKKTLVVDPVTAGKYFVTAKASADKQPIVVGPDGKTALAPSAVYSGCYVNAQISIYGFKVDGSEGVAIGINYLQFVRDGERLGGGGPSISEATSVFGAVPGAAAPALPNMGFGGPPPASAAPGLPGAAPVAPTGSLPALPA